MRIRKIVKTLPIIFIFFTLIVFVRLYDSLEEMKRILNEQTATVQNTGELSPIENNSYVFQQAQQAEKNANIAMFAAILVNSAIIVIVWRSFSLIETRLNELGSMSKHAYQIAEGEFDVDLSSYESNSEFGVLARSFTNSMKTAKDFVGDVEYVSEQHTAGNIDAKPDAEKFKGSYQEATRRLSCMTDSYKEMISEVSAVLNSFAAGDYDAKVKDFPGKKHELNKSLEQLRQTLKNGTEKQHSRPPSDGLQ